MARDSPCIQTTNPSWAFSGLLVVFRRSLHQDVNVGFSPWPPMSLILKHRPGGLNGNADGLSRLPLPSTGEDPPVPGEIVCLLEHVSSSVMDVAHIRQQTQRDLVLSRVLLYVQQGWPGKVLQAELKPYFARQNELSSEQGCVLWGARLVLPTTSQS